MLEDPFDDLLILNEGNNAHRAAAFGAGEGIYLIDFLNQSGPVSPIFF
jgi:hypothetical protein